MFKKILVPLDGSELSDSILPWIRLLAENLRPEPRFQLFRAFEPPSIVYLLPELSMATSHVLSNERLRETILGDLDRIKNSLKELQVDTKVSIGDPASTILELSESSDLVLISSHGRGGLGKWLMGSVATKVARGIKVPLLVIGAKVPRPPKNLAMNHILCAVDGSAASRRAFDLGGQLATQFGSKLHIYRGVSQVELRDSLALKSKRKGLEQALNEVELLARTAPEGVEVEHEVVETYGHTGIAQFAEEMGADLVCIGSHGKSGFERWMLGSETEKMLQTAKCPVLVTR
jgi:nucleotide-binding universal stress UspA family protein